MLIIPHACMHACASLDILLPCACSRGKAICSVHKIVTYYINITFYRNLKLILIPSSMRKSWTCLEKGMLRIFDEWACSLVGHLR